MLALALSLGACAGARQPVAAPLADKALRASQSGIEALAAGEHQRALDSFGESLRINRALDNRRGEITDLLNIGRTLVHADEPARAEAHFRDAASLAEATSDKRGLSEAQASIAQVELATGRTRDALWRINESLKIDQELGITDPARLNLKAHVLIEIGGHMEAEAYVRRAMDASHAAHDIVAADSLRAMGDIARAGGRVDEALGFYHRAYDMDRRLGAPVKVALDLERMAEIAFVNGRTEEALFLMKRSHASYLNSGRKADALRCLDSLIRHYDGLGRTEEAVFYRKVRDDMAEAAAGGREVPR